MANSRQIVLNCSVFLIMAYCSKLTFFMSMFTSLWKFGLWFPQSLYITKIVHCESCQHGAMGRGSWSVTIHHFSYAAHMQVGLTTTPWPWQLARVMLSSGITFCIVSPIMVFRQNASVAFWPYVMTGIRQCHRSSSITKVSQSCISRIFWPRITKFYTNVHTGRVYIHTGYGVTGYFRSTVIERSKMPPPVPSVKISRDHFKWGSRNFTCLSQTTGPTNLRDLTSLTDSCRLQNAIKCCTKVRKTGPAGQRVEFGHCLT